MHARTLPRFACRRDPLRHVAEALLVAMLLPASAMAQPGCVAPLPEAYTRIPDDGCDGHTGLVPGDWNGDGRTDLVTYCNGIEPTGSLQSEPLHTYLGSENGLVRGPDIVAPSTWMGPFVRALDVNGDSKVDLIDGGTPPIVWYGHGDGTFDPPMPIAGISSSFPSENIASFYPIDLNADGRIDLVSFVFSIADPLEVRTYLADGTGGFVRGSSLPFPADVAAIQVADFDRDHRGDLIFVAYFPDGSRQTLVYRGDGTGSFLPPMTLPVPPGDNPMRVAGIVDWDGDDNLDVMLLGTHDYQYRFFLYRGNGDGTFQDPVISDPPPQPAPPSLVADLNGDSIPDMIQPLPLVEFQVVPGFRTIFGLPDGHLGAIRDYPHVPYSYVDPSFRPPLAAFQVVGDSAPDLVALVGRDLIVYENQGNGAFGKIPVLPIPDRTDAVRTADLNGDHRTDFIVHQRPISFRAAPDTLVVEHLTAPVGLNRVQILSMEAPPDPPLSEYLYGPFFRDFLLSDLTGDGIPELVVLRALDATHGVISEFRGLPGGTFGARTDLPIDYDRGEYLYSITSADLNRDGFRDVLLVRLDDNPESFDRMGGVALFAGHDDGTLSPPVELFRSFGLVRFALQDVNQDGNLDLLAYEYQQPYVFAPDLAFTVRLGTGTGGFGSPTDRPVLPAPFNFAGGLLNARLRMADVNGDGHADVVIMRGVRDHLLPEKTQAHVFLGHDDGTFSGPVVATADLPYSSSFFVGDLGGDGRADMIVGEWASLHVFCGQSDGSLAEGPAIATIQTPFAMVAADLDGDHGVDLAVLSDPSRSVLAFHRNLLQAGVPIAATMTFDPPVIQPNSRGPWVHVTVQLATGHSASEIDVASLRIGGVAAVSKTANVGDANSDGVPDLTVAFPRAPFQELSPGEHTVELSGSLAAGESFAAHTTIRVLPAHGGGRLALRVISPLGASPVVLEITGPPVRERTVRVFDIRGRLVRTWKESAEADQPVTWDGRDGNGGNASSGIYFTRVSTPAGVASARTVLLR